VRDIEVVVHEAAAEQFSAVNVLPEKPMWRDPRKGPYLAVYQQGERRPGEWRTTKSRDDVYGVVLEYVEPATKQVQGKKLQRDPEAEQKAREFADEVVAWCDSHQAFGDDGIWRFDFMALRYPNDVPREGLIRYWQVVCEAHRVATYAGA
jgi:hypothetical protein